MATFTATKNKITAWLTNNLTKFIRGQHANEITTDIINAVSENVSTNQIPVMVGDQFVGYATLLFTPSSGKLGINQLSLQYGIAYAERIHNTGTLTLIQGIKAVPTVFYTNSVRRVVGVITDPIDLANNLRVGDTVTLQGGISHVIIEGDTFLLQGQTNRAENVPYTAISADDAPEIPAWYDGDKNQEISIDKGSAVKVVMPAVDEGDPVVDPDFGRVAYDLFFDCNY